MLKCADIISHQNGKIQSKSKAGATPAFVIDSHREIVSKNFGLHIPMVMRG